MVKAAQISRSVVIGLLVMMIWIAIHLGKNPRNGGSPPNDRRLVLRAYLVIVLMFLLWKYCAMWNVLVLFKDLATVTESKE